MRVLNRRPLVLLCALICCVGCGGDYQKPVARACGVVRLDGNIVTEGYVVFTPVPPSGADLMSSGKAATGVISSDGSFELTTYGDRDGALIGKHVATFFRPDPEDDEQIVRDNYIPGGKEIQLEVLDSDNDFDIHLHASGAAEVNRLGES